MPWSVPHTTYVLLYLASLINVSILRSLPTTERWNSLFFRVAKAFRREFSVPEDYEYLDVDNININSSTITASQPLTINSTDTITINNRKITGVIDPTVEKDVANKNYVDTQIDSERVIITLDVTN